MTDVQTTPPDSAPRTAEPTPETSDDVTKLGHKDNEVASVSVVEEAEEGSGEVEIPQVEESVAEVVMSKPDVEESSDSVELVEESPSKEDSEVKENDVEDVEMEDITEEIAPVVEVESVSKVESAPAPVPTENIPEGSGQDSCSGESYSEKESEALLSEEVEEEITGVEEEGKAEDDVKKRYPILHLICSLILVGGLFFLSMSPDSTEPDQMTAGLSALLFVYLTTFAAADLEMIDPEKVVPVLITLFNTVVCPCLLTFVLGNPAFCPAEEVGLVTPLLAWLLGIELWVQFDKMDWRKVTLGVGVVLVGLAVHMQVTHDGQLQDPAREDVVIGE